MNQKVLFLKLGAIGDVIMALPAVRSLVSQGHHVTWVCGKTVAPIVRHFSTVQHITEVHDQLLLKGTFQQKIMMALELNARLFGKKFDQVFVGNPDPRYRFLVKSVRGPLRQFHPDPLRHHSYEYFKFVDAGAFGILDLKDFWPPPLVEYQGKGSRKIALAPGGARNLLADDDFRRWPVENYAELARHLLSQGYDVHIFGATTDQWVLPAFAGLKIKNRVGELDLMGLLKEWSGFELLVTHDSGPLHLGGLAGLPVLGLFGPTLPEWRFPIANSGMGITAFSSRSEKIVYDEKNYIRNESAQLKNLTVERVLSEASLLLNL